MDQHQLYILNDEKVSKALRQLAIPAIMGMLINAIYNFFDKMFAGMLGTGQFSAGAIVFPIFLMIGAIGLTFGIGAGSYISRLLGEGNKEMAGKVAMTALFSSTVVGLLVMVFGLFFLKEIVIVFGAIDTVLEYSMAYAKYIFVGAIFTTVNMTMNNMLRAEGSIKVATLSLTIGAVINILLDPIFMFLLGWGIGGAAIATAVSQAISTVFLLFYYFSGRSVIHLKITKITLSRHVYFEIMKIGLPTFIRQILGSFAIAFTNNQAKLYGQEAIAAMGGVLTVFMLSFHVVFGYTQGFQPMAGYNYGAKHYHRLNKAIWVSMMWTTIYSVVVTLVFMLFTRQVLGMFSSDPAVLDIGVIALRRYAIILPFLGVIVTLIVLFQSLGHAKEAALLSLTRQGIFLLPAIFILPRYFGFNGLMWAQPLADLLTCILTISLSIPLLKSLLNEEHKMGIGHKHHIKKH